MQILRASDYKVMPWKNGLGSTTEIAVSPDRDGLGNFDWRISMARVTRDGPFSLFPGIDRTLLVLDGNGICLTVGEKKSIMLDRAAIHAFPGDQPTSATLADGPITDLNVMSRRHAVAHEVRRIKVMKPQDIIVSTQTFLFVEHGALIVRSGENFAELSTHDALSMSQHTPRLTIEAALPVGVIVIEFR